MRLRYNAPVILTFVFACTIVLAVNQFIAHNLIAAWFTVPPHGAWHASSFRNWVNLVSHVVGHANWTHLSGNLLIMLIVGPLLEETYGSAEMLFMFFVTALVTGVINILFLKTGLLGASGLVFMLILLASFTNFRRGEIPLTFILVLIFYVGSEVVQSFKTDGTAHFAHIAGCLCGSLFGFFKPAGKFG